MAVVVVVLADTPAELAEWDRYVDGHPDAAIYHLSAWRRIFFESFGYRSWLLAARDSDSGRIVGVLPLYLVAAPFARRLVAVPFRDRGGVLWDTLEAFDALVRTCVDIADAAGVSSVVLKSVTPYPPQAVRALGLSERAHWIRSVVALGGATTASLWKSIGEKNRNMVRQARRNGLIWEPLEATPDSLDKWHDLHVATQKRLGIPPFPRKFFASMARLLGDGGKLALVGVMRERTLCAATLLLLHRRNAMYAYSASNSAGQRTRANDLMLYEVMRWLIEQGYETFDLGSDSPLQQSLLFFKRKWRATQAPIPHYFLGQPSRIDSSECRYALARRCLSLLPAPALAAVGAVITRYFG